MKLGVIAAGGIGNWVLASPMLRAMELLGHRVDLLICEEDARTAALEEISWLTVHNIRRFAPAALRRRYHLVIAFQHPTTLPPEIEDKLDKAGNAKIYPRLSWRRMNITEVDYFMQAARIVGWDGPAPMPHVPTHAPTHPRQQLPPHIGFGIGGWSHTDWDKKLWPWQSWQALAESLPPDIPVYAYGGLSDAYMLARLSETNRITGMGGLHLGCVAWLLKNRCQLFISNDTGTMHIAAAVGTPLVALFGPTLRSKNGPYGPGPKSVIMSQLACAPCYNTSLWDVCPGGCMGQISVEQVVREAMNLWETANADQSRSL